MTVLLVQLYFNQFMLVTPRAIYSFGTRYAPFRKPFIRIKDELQRVNHFLLLGTGLGSALKILQDTYHVFPAATLIDNDLDVLRFSTKYMHLNKAQNVEWICKDAIEYLTVSSKKYDLIGVDIFRDLVQPEFTTTGAFFTLCARALNPKGICLFNMILHDDNEIVDVERKLKRHFSKVTFIIDKVNTYFICRVA